MATDCQRRYAKGRPFSYWTALFNLSGQEMLQYGRNNAEGLQAVYPQSQNAYHQAFESTATEENSVRLTRPPSINVALNEEYTAGRAAGGQPHFD